MSRSLTPTSLALAATLAAAPALPAQVRQTLTPTESFTLAFPATTVEAMGTRTGASWDVVRRGGLVLNVLGRGEYTVSVVAVVVAQGRITRAWTSPKRQVSGGTHTLAGRDFIPGDQFLPGDQFVPGEQAGATVSVDLARKAAVVGGDATVLLGKGGSTASGVAFVLIPEGAGGSATTNPRFARTETMAD